jgi:hypothetical protein
MSNVENDDVNGVASASRSIEDLIYSYSRFVDAGDFGGVGALFEEATFAVGRGDPFIGGEAVKGMLENSLILHADGTPRTMHLVTNLSIEIDAAAGTATSSSYVTVMQATPDIPLQTILVGRYFDEFLRRDSLWMFKRRQLKIDLVGDVSHHRRAS